MDSDSSWEPCESATPKRPRLQSEPRSTVDNEYNITGLETNNNFNCFKDTIFDFFYIVQFECAMIFVTSYKFGQYTWLRRVKEK